MKKEDKEFLQQLQHEMLTQDTVGQANPRFWVVMQTVRDYWIEDDIDGICIYDKDAAESVFEGELERITEWVKQEFDMVTKCEYDNGFIEIICEDGKEYFSDDISTITEFLEEYDYGRFSVCSYRNRAEIVPDTMFLTLRECKEHIKSNSYHYKNPHPYAMTAWRSPQVARLYEILMNTDWKNL
ncbi:TPA: hypothetical protein N2D10_003127 [Clostridium botulinum]|nr:hypothetical protein [Clostridium botulinum]